MKKKAYRLQNVIPFFLIFFGSIWLINGILNLFKENEIILLISSILLLLGNLGYLFIFFIRTDTFDEMAKIHISKACTVGLLVTFLFLIFINLVLEFLSFAGHEIILEFSCIYPFILAVGYITVGLLFLHLERADI